MDDASADRASRLMGRRGFLAIGAGVKHIGLEPVTFDVHATAAHQTEGVGQNGDLRSTRSSEYFTSLATILRPFTGCRDSRG